jgi:hypothetical protein
MSFFVTVMVNKMRMRMMCDVVIYYPKIGIGGVL